MKEKIIEILQSESIPYTYELDLLYSTDFEKVADKIVNLVKEIIIEYGTDYSNLLK